MAPAAQKGGTRRQGGRASSAPYHLKGREGFVSLPARGFVSGFFSSASVIFFFFFLSSLLILPLGVCDRSDHQGEEDDDDSLRVCTLRRSPCPSLCFTVRMMRGERKKNQWSGRELMSNRYVQVVGLLSTGSVCTVLAKTAYQTRSYGEDDTEMHYFTKPWFMTLMQFSSMAGCLILHWGIHGCNCNCTREEISIKQLRHLMLPAILGASGATFMNAALVYVNASVLEMMKVCLRLVTAALLSSIFLKRIFNKVSHFIHMPQVHSIPVLSVLSDSLIPSQFHIWGMVVLILGGTVVAVDAALQHREDLSNNVVKQVIGLAMVVLSSILQGSQMVAEEFYIRKYPIHPLQLLGYQGIIALVVVVPLLVVLQLMKGSDYGSVESTWDSILMICQSTRLQILLPIYLICGLVYLAFGITVTANTGAAFRSIVVSIKSLFVWSLEVALFYSTNGGFGEKFDWVYSSVEAGGYLIVTCGIFLYTKGQAEASPHSHSHPQQGYARLPSALDEEEEANNSSDHSDHLNSFDSIKSITRM